MISIKQYFLFRILFLVYLFHTGYSLQCKTCQKNDPACVSGQDVETRNCASDEDLCYSWFDRTKIEVSVQRDCISIQTPEYKLMNKMIQDRNSGCVKRPNGLDCFTFCSYDKCN